MLGWGAGSVLARLTWGELAISGPRLLGPEGQLGWGNPASIPGPTRPHPRQVNLPLSQWPGQAPGLLVRSRDGTCPAPSGPHFGLEFRLRPACTVKVTSSRVADCSLPPVFEQQGRAFESRWW